jgi:glutamine phosphoribosylpyrophosphate amidotransferase
MNTIKTFTIPTDLKLFADSPSKGFIYHNRYSTSGDWHTEINNQPITHQNISVAMNGVVSMKPRKEYEKEYGIKCSTENDSEIFLRLLEKGIPPEDVIKQMGGSCAVVWLEDNKVYAIRNQHRPLHYFIKDDAVFVCSTNDIAHRAVGVKTEEILPYSLFDLDAYV